MTNRTNPLLLTWSESFQAGSSKVGGKGWNLGRLARYGFKIPAGGVLPVGIYKQFIQENELLQMLETINRQITLDNVMDQATSEQLKAVREKILDAEFSEELKDNLKRALKAQGLLGKPLAIRSSASLEDSSRASFAGIHDSVLNISGFENILQAIKICYASLWSNRAVAYRRKLGFSDEEVLLAIVIMEMVDAKAAGVGFSCDPHLGREDIMVINANFGLGESVVSGAAEPDEYMLELGDLMPHLSKKHLGRKEGVTIPKVGGGVEFKSGKEIDPSDQIISLSQVLEDEQIEKLARMIQRVFQSLGEGEHHQDVEWVWDGTEFVLVQARPVTTLPQYTYPQLQGQPAFWSNGNIKDALPMVQSPLARFHIRDLTTSIINAMFKAINFPLLPGAPYYRLFEGRGYFNTSVIQWEDFDAWGISPKETNETLGGHQEEIVIPSDELTDKTKKLKRNLRKLKLGLAIYKAQHNAEKEFNKIRASWKHWLNEDLSKYEGWELLAAVQEINDLTRSYTPVPGLLNVALGMPWLTLMPILERFFPGRGKTIGNALILGQGHIISAEQGYQLLHLAELARQDKEAQEFLSNEPFEPLAYEKRLSKRSLFKQEFHKFIEKFGHRAVYEGEISNPRWREDPTYLLEQIKQLREYADLGQLKANQRERRVKALNEIRQTIPFYYRYVVKRSAKEVVKGSEMREMAKSELVRCADMLRILVQEIAERFVQLKLIDEPKDIFFCTWPDIIAVLQNEWEGKQIRLLVEERKIAQKQMESQNPPDLIIGDMPQTNRVQINPEGKVFEGIAVSTGIATGKARIINHPDEGKKLKQGEILVAPSTDPGWTPLFLKASGLIMETGGFLSHGAIVAREYGIPAVVNIPGILEVIDDGQEVTVQGHEGRVYIKYDKLKQ